MITLDRLKTTDCRPAGSPMRRILDRSSRLTPSLRRSSLAKPFSRSRKTTTSVELTTFDTTVAMATPATSRWKTMTSRRFSPAFRTPAQVRQNSGRRVSPMLLRMADAKL